MTDQMNDQTRLKREAIIFLRDKEPEELLEIQEVLVATGFDTSMSGEAFGYACSQLGNENPDQQYQFGLLLAQHNDPTMRLLAYWRLIDFLDRNEEAEQALWLLLGDPDANVAARYIQRLREEVEMAPRPFPRVIALMSLLCSAERRLQAK
jgi:hypothetical protein